MSDKLTKEQAETEVERLHKVEPDWFCPLINKMCNSNCVCMVAARLVVQGGNYIGAPFYYIVTKPFCGNAMFVNYSRVDSNH